MRFRGKSIRRKIVALLLVPLLSLTALWAFTTVLTGREASELLDANSATEDVGEPVTRAIDTLQQERRQTLVYLADRRASAALPELRTRRGATDAAVAEVRARASEADTRETLRTEGERKLGKLVKGYDGLAALRRSVETGTITRAEALEYYNGIVDPGFAFLNALHSLGDVGLERQGRAIVGLGRAREALAREDALIASAFTAGRVDAEELRELTGLVARREVLYDTSLEALLPKDREIHRLFWKGPETAPLRDAEKRLTSGDPVRHASASEVAEWQVATAPVLDELRDEGSAAQTRHEDRVEPATYDVFVKAGVAGVLGFAALLASVVVSVRIGRDLIRDLSRLSREAHEVSSVRLPSVMRRLAAGEQVDVETEAPRLQYEKDEIGQAGHALNTLQRAAVEAAVRQAEMRRGVSEVFVNLARRNQVLLHRQLTLLDTMERRTEDTDELADLFRLDHLTTRMRRHAEGLVILSGATPSRQWRKPVQLMDVVRAAVAEVEDYERIEVRRLARIGVGGSAVADLTHLIAELLENATVFSPPHTTVQVHGERVANGFTLEIHDRGLGMAPEVLLDANLRLAETPEFELSNTDRLGLFVVSRLAQRQNVRVSLQPSPYGGTSAIVFVPAALLTDAPDTESRGVRIDRAGNGPFGRRNGKGDGGAKASALAKGGQRRNGPALLGGSTDRDALDDPEAPDGLSDVLPPLVPYAPQPDAGRRAPLPRRAKPPTLITDGGRRVDGPARAHPVPFPEPLPASDAAAPDLARAGSADRPEAPVEAPDAVTDPSPALVDGLPRRVRQASLAPQLRAAPDLGRTRQPAARRDEAPGLGPDDERDPDQVRARMAAMQRGWQRGRRQHVDGADGADGFDQSTGPGTGRPAPRTTSEGDGP
ncbi:nitrate- and nitrite sensing domain-containing protein [Streptomyces sp. NPDC020412]|uniref:sensor histidine kinase n=1 Tax=Streptomyces sp. NPDC020412 TaxID=3365073 RepID=UPI003795A818